MATDEQKKENLLRLSRIYVLSLAAAIWDFVGDSALALRPQIGERILAILEKEMGLEVAGEKPEDVLLEITRLLQDEFGFCGSVELAVQDKSIVMKIANSLDLTYAQALAEVGVEQNFISPIVTTGLVALKRMGWPARAAFDVWPEGKGAIITFQLV